jgi:hypothetical protein
MDINEYAVEAPLSIIIPDAIYYEITYDNDNDKIYLDAYRKEQNDIKEV